MQRLITFSKMISFFFAVLLLSSAAWGQASVVQTATPSNLQELMSRGAEFDAGSKYPDAISVFNQVIEAFPEDARARYRRGLSYFHCAKYSDAITDFSKAIMIDPDYKDARVIRGMAYAESKDYDKALEDFDWVIKADSQFKEVLERRADVYKKQGKTALAKASKKEIAVLQGRPLLAEGEPAEIEAKAFMSSVETRIKNNWSVYGHEKDSILVVDFKLHRSGRITDVQIVKGAELQAFVGEAKKAIDAVDGTIVCPPGFPEFADVHFTFELKAMGKPNTALLLSNAREGQSALPNFQRLIVKAAALDAKSKYPEAISVLNQAIANYPNEARAYYRRGLSYFHNARYEEAIVDLTKAISLNDKYQDAHIIRGRAYADSKQFDKAVQDFDWVLDRDREFKEVLQLKAAALDEKGDKEVAKALKEKCSSFPKRDLIAEGEPADAYFGKYMKALESQIKANWRPGNSTMAKSVATVFKVYRDGSISDVKIDHATGYSKFDNAAIEAIKGSGRAKPFPPGAPGKVDVQFTFDYRVFGGSNGPPKNEPAKDTSPPEVRFVSKGEELQNNGKYEDAIAFYINALALYQKQIYADNTKVITEIMSALAKCNSFLAKKHKDHPELRMQYLHQAVYYAHEDIEYKDALRDAIKQAGKDPQSAQDHVSIGDEAFVNGDNVSAVVEYMEALKIKDDPAVQQKIQRIKDSYGK